MTKWLSWWRRPRSTWCPKLVRKILIILPSFASTRHFNFLFLLTKLIQSGILLRDCTAQITPHYCPFHPGCTLIEQTTFSCLFFTKTGTAGNLPRWSGFPAACAVRTGLALQSLCSSHFLVMCLVHMNNKAAGSNWLGLHFAACVHEGLLPAWRGSSYWLETDRKCCLNIMKTQIWVYSFHNFSLAAAILFCLNTPHLCPPPIFLHRTHSSTKLWLVCMLTCTHVPLASCPVSLLFFLPRCSASLSLFVLTLSMQRVFTADILSNASIEPQMTRNPHLHCMPLHANICAKLYLNILLDCVHPEGVSREKNPKVCCMRACNILANETIGTIIEAFTAQIGKTTKQKKGQRCRGKLFISPNRGGPP